MAYHAYGPTCLFDIADHHAATPPRLALHLRFNICFLFYALLSFGSAISFRYKIGARREGFLPLCLLLIRVIFAANLLQKAMMLRDEFRP